MPSATFATRFGRAYVAWTERGVQRFLLPGGVLPPGDATPVDSVQRAIDLVILHLAGTPQAFDHVELDFEGVPPFHAKVYRALRQVPAGSTVSYMQLAALTGSPGATRAVGTAMAKNPWPLLVPCHRVLGEGGRLGGFSAPGGVATKVRLLALEGVVIDSCVQLALADPALGRHIARVGPCGLEVKRPASLFEALARSIVYQQLTGKAAATIFARVKAAYPRGLRAEDTASLTDDAILACGLSRSKLAAMRDLSAKAVAGELPTLEAAEDLSDETLIELVSRVRGIGPWSVEMVLMFSLGRPDVLSFGDYGLRKGFQKLFRLPALPTADEFARRGERWRPFRSVASWYLWRAADMA